MFFARSSYHSSIYKLPLDFLIFAFYFLLIIYVQEPVAQAEEKTKTRLLRRLINRTAKSINTAPPNYNKTDYFRKKKAFFIYGEKIIPDNR